jgi:hypothetical protein
MRMEGRKRGRKRKKLKENERTDEVLWLKL